MPVLSVQDYPKVQNLVKNLFPFRISPGLPLSGRVKYFLENSKKLTKDPSILEIVQGYKIPFLETSHQTFLPKAGRGKEISGTRNRTNATERCNFESEYDQGSIWFKQSVMVKLDADQLSQINLETLTQLFAQWIADNADHSTQILTMDGVALLILSFTA